MTPKQQAIAAVEAYISGMVFEEVGAECPFFARSQADELMRIIENTVTKVCRNPTSRAKLLEGAEAKPRNVIEGSA